jgi:rSAM/selenodomain-associated transferase 1
MIGLALMAKRPVPGAVKTRLCPPLSVATAAGLATCLLQDSISRIRRIERVTPILAFDPPEADDYFRRLAGDTMQRFPQGSGDLGERMSRVLSRLLETHAGALVLGADLPTLPDRFLTEAVATLEGGAADGIVGPSEDGGYYAIGLRRPAPELFQGIEWSTTTVLAETLCRADGLGLRLHLLPAWFDVDTAGAPKNRTLHRCLPALAGRNSLEQAGLSIRGWGCREAARPRPQPRSRRIRSYSSLPISPMA